MASWSSPNGCCIGTGGGETYFDNMISLASQDPPAGRCTLAVFFFFTIGSKHLPNLTGFTVVNQLTSTTSLEVLNASGYFIGVPPIPNTLVLNMGDFLERATNHVFSSTINRVIHLANVDRYSLAYFFDADPNAMIDIVETCLRKE